MKIHDALKSVHHICIDTAPLIYYVEANPTFLPKMDVIVNHIENHPIKASFSVITLTEVLTHPFRLGDAKLAQDYRDILLNNQDFAVQSITPQIAESAANLRARYNLRTPDALHVATAIDIGCDAFLTNDMVIKRVTELLVLVLDELVP